MEWVLERCYSMNMKRAMLALLALSSVLQAGGNGSRVLYVGGTVAGVPMKTDARLELSQDDAFSLKVHQNIVKVPYKDVNQIEYGMRVNRRYMEAVFISPVFLVAKRRTHFLTIGYVDSNGKQQAMVFQVGKDEIRLLLVSLEARTGRSIEYQDEEARKAGKG